MIILPEDNIRNEWYTMAINHGMTEEQAARFADKKVKEITELGNNDSYK